ncbi:MAG: MFS transporter [Planctomycetes bacterium]|nr:MFS transporter [Planctomycetota bacterium]
MSRARLPRTVYALGLVSFATDLASEMVVPLLPAFLAGLGGGMVELGLLHGLGELVVAGLKIVSGRWSDRQQKRKPWLVVGYGLAALMRPAFALCATPLQAVLVRSLDRVGKGLRAAPRDALLTEVVPADRRGAAFGVQRAFDHAGACGGALLAAWLLWLGCSERQVFAAALVPGFAALLVLWLLVREVPAAEVRPTRPVVPAAPGTVGRLAPLWLVVVLAAMAAAVDLFLLARARELGVPPAALPLLWALLHVVRAGFAAPLGALSDRLGRRAVLGTGLLVHTGVMAGFALLEGSPWLWPLFALHGLHAAFSEGAERGLVADLSGADRRGAVFGLFHALQGGGALVGALWLGLVWERGSAALAFGVAAGLALLAAVLLAWLVPGRRAAAAGS